MSSHWIQNYESCKSYGQEINQKLIELKRLPNGTSQRIRLSSTVQSMISEFGKDVEKLSQEVTNHKENRSITDGEADRRRRMIDNLRQMKQEAEMTMAEIRGFSPSSRTDPRLIAVTETEQTQNLTNEDFDGLRTKLRKNNDEAIEALQAAVRRQREIGHAMNREIDRHNEIIETISDGTSLLEGRVRRQTLFAKQLQKKSSACILWLIVLLLFVAIVVIVAIPL